MLKESTSSPQNGIPVIAPRDATTPSTIELASVTASTPPLNGLQSTSSPESVANLAVPMVQTTGVYPTAAAIDPYANGVSLTPITMTDSAGVQTSYITSAPEEQWHTGYDMLWSAWPRDLPSYNLVRHLYVLHTMLFSLIVNSSTDSF